jgi:hypothetical protein
MKNLKMLSKVMAMAGLMAMAVACSKGSDNSSVYPAGYYPGCTTCGILPGGGAGASSITAGFQTPMQEAVGTANIIVQGSQVIVQGQMQVPQQSWYLCYTPPGMYSLQTVQPGMIDGAGDISNLVFQAGPLTFQVSRAMIVNPGSGSYRFSILQGMIQCGSVTTN